MRELNHLASLVEHFTPLKYPKIIKPLRYWNGMMDGLLLNYQANKKSLQGTVAIPVLVTQALVNHISEMNKAFG